MGFRLPRSAGLALLLRPDMLRAPRLRRGHVDHVLRRGRELVPGDDHGIPKGNRRARADDAHERRRDLCPIACRERIIPRPIFGGVAQAIRICRRPMRA